MSQTSNNVKPIPISSTKRTLTPITSYIGIILLIALLFLPIFGLVETEEIDGEKIYISAACSPFQMLINKTEVKTHVYGGTEEENEFLEFFTGSTDVIEDSLLSDDIARLLVLGITYVFCLYTAILYIALSKKPKSSLFIKNPKEYQKKSLTYENKKIAAELFGTKITGKIAFPLVFIVLAPIIAYGIPFVIPKIDFTSSMITIDSIRPNIDWIRLVLALLIFWIAAILACGGISEKESSAIVKHNLIYDPTQQVLRPRTPQEMDALYRAALGDYYDDANIPHLDTNTVADAIPNNTSNSSSEQENIQLLKSYKELLDSGVISQEEFEEKKNELLKSKRK